MHIPSRKQRLHTSHPFHDWTHCMMRTAMKLSAKQWRCNRRVQVIALADYRGQLYDYLKARMAAIAPNLTVLVGELVGARLIAHAGSLINLAKVPASTVQVCSPLYTALAVSLCCSTCFYGSSTPCSELSHPCAAAWQAEVTCSEQGVMLADLGR